MKHLFTIIIVIFIYQNLYTQPWQITSKIEYNSDIILKGQIDSLYDITMKLNIGATCGLEEFAHQWRNREISGWYYYDNIKSKIPLIGYFNGSDGFLDRNTDGTYKYLELFVPKNYFADSINNSTCFPSEFSERFYNKSEFNFTSMIWNKNGRELPVKLNIIENRNLETNADLVIRFYGDEITRINISSISEKKYIENISIFDVKDHKGKIHITFSFYERTTPGGSGGGYCGAGIEKFIGYIQLKKDWEIEKFDFKQTHSCCCWSKVENYRIELGQPELGLIANDK